MELYPKEEDSRPFVADVGLDAGRIAFSGKASTTWHSILEQAQREDKVDAAVATALNAFGNNEDLEAALLDYQAWQASGAADQAACEEQILSLKREIDFVEEQIHGLHEEKRNFSRGAQLTVLSIREREAQDKRTGLKRELHSMKRRCNDRQGLSRVRPAIFDHLDRKPQKRAIEKAVNRLKELQPPRPLVCVIYGERRHHHDFLDSLHRTTLPELLDLPVKPLWRSPAWPRHTQDHREYCSILLKNLCDQLPEAGSLGSADVTGLQQILAPYPCVMFTWHLDDEDWLPNKGRRVVEEFLKFWNDWPDLATSQWLILCLNVKYQRKAGLINRLMSIIQGDIERYVEEAEKIYSDFPRLACVRLPKLGCFQKAEAEEWADSWWIRKANPEIKKKVQEILVEWESKTSSQEICISDFEREMTASLI